MAEHLVSWQALEEKAKQYDIHFEHADNRVTMEHVPSQSFIDCYTDSGNEEQARRQAQSWLWNTCDMIDTLNYTQQTRPKRKKFLGLF